MFLVQSIEIESRSELLFAKSRLAPTQGMTIPRLELMAMLIGVRSLKFVTNQINLTLERSVVFSDSQCVLHWLNTEKHISVFVNNRVREIKKHSDIEFRYVSTKCNPADIASRGCDTKKISESSLWWHGPEWLANPLSTWPTNECDTQINDESKQNFESEVKTKESNLLIDAQNAQTISTPLGIDIERFSTLTKLFRVTATALRFIQKLKSNNVKGCLTNDEIERAEEMWILHTQQKCFKDVYHDMSENKSNNLQRQLGIYVDNKGLLRCKGRLENAMLTESARCPILLATKDRLTKLIIDNDHKQVLHSGVSQTLCKLRAKYWVPKGRATVKYVLKSCLVCKRLESGPFKMPPMAPIPRARVTQSTPFTNTGLDYLGPLYIKEGDVKKVWICIFTCMVTRAIHLELVSDMSTNAFLNCLRRFIASRGTPRHIVSDNANWQVRLQKRCGRMLQKVTRFKPTVQTME